MWRALQHIGHFDQVKDRFSEAQSIRPGVIPNLDVGANWN